MSSLAIAAISAGSIVGGAVLGMVLSRMLPAEHLSADSRDAVKVGAGMISLMSALVLGLLVTSAKGNFDEMSASVTQGGAKIILLDRVLAHYGPESAEVRQHLRRAVAAGLEMLWPEERPTASGLDAFERASAMEGLLDEIRHLRPQSEAQHALHAQAIQLGNELLLSRWVEIERVQTSPPTLLLQILLFWLTMLYASFGLIAPRNATVVAVLLIGALSLATAVFLILEMNDPLGGLVKISSGPMRKALESLGQ
jgi:hypothetical protein